jgi:hypothetical protein
MGLECARTQKEASSRQAKHKQQASNRQADKQQTSNRQAAHEQAPGDSMEKVKNNWQKNWQKDVSDGKPVTAVLSSRCR